MVVDRISRLSASSVMAIRMPLSRHQVPERSAADAGRDWLAGSRRAAWYVVVTLYQIGNASAAESSTNSAT